MDRFRLSPPVKTRLKSMGVSGDDLCTYLLDRKKVAPIIASERLYSRRDPTERERVLLKRILRSLAGTQ